MMTLTAETDPARARMPLYHFDLRDGGTFIKDDEGMELPNVGCAQMEAARIIG
jgi:hypothetical protein